MRSLEPDLFGQWLADARNGSSEARGKLLESCRQYLLWLANHELAEDVQGKAGASDMVQQTFLRAEMGFEGFRGQDEEELRGWLRQILKNVVSNFHRDYRETEKRRVAKEKPLPGIRSGIDEPSGLPDPARSPSSLCSRDEEKAQLIRAIERLPADYRQIIALRYWQRLSFPQIGEEMNRSADASRKLWARAMVSLERELESLAGAPR